MHETNLGHENVVQPVGVRWVAAYSVLIATGYGQYGLGYLLKGTELFLGIVFSSLAILFAAVVYGLLKQKVWGYKLSLILYNVLAAFEILRLTYRGPGEIYATVEVLLHGQAILFAVWIIYYLRREKVKIWFGLIKPGNGNTLSPQAKMEEEISSIKKNGFIAVLLFVLPSLFSFSIWIDGKVSPIPELSEMTVTEGVLTNVTGGTRRGGLPYLTVKKESGELLIVAVANGNEYGPYIGGHVKVWSKEDCRLGALMCRESAYQVRYFHLYVIEGFLGNSKLLLDFEEIRRNKEEMKYEFGSNFDLIFVGIGLFLALLGYYCYFYSKKKIERIRKEFGDEVENSEDSMPTRSELM